MSGEHKFRIDCGPPPSKWVAETCRNCDGLFFVQGCHAGRYACCSMECTKELRLRKFLARQMSCVVCGKQFFPRTQQLKDGNGRYCSIKCSASFTCSERNKDHEFQLKAQAVRRKKLATGETRLPSGPDNKQWSGGPAASRARNKHKFAQRTKEYREKNPEKVREWVQSRNRRKHGKLPKGTVAKIKELQRGRCAICKTRLPGSLKGTHVDHILPLRLGGKHEPTNIQLLCSTCNVRKSWKHPVDYMQELGFLL